MSSKFTCPEPPSDTFTFPVQAQAASLSQNKTVINTDRRHSIFKILRGPLVFISLQAIKMTPHVCVSTCGGILDCSLPPWTGFSGECGAHRGPIATWTPSLCWNCMQIAQLMQHLRVLGIQTPDPRACVASSSTTELPPHKNNRRENNSKHNQPGVRVALTWWSHRL